MRSLSTKRNLLTKGNAKKFSLEHCRFHVCIFVFMNSVCPAFADTAYKSDVSKLAKSVVDIVGYIFRVVGIIMAVYAIGTLIQAFQSNNPDAQSRGATTAVVAVILIFIPTIIKSLDLTSYLTK